jgi:hypothetical protein
MNASVKALLASYARSVLSAGTALYLAGITDPADLAWSLVAALAPVALRAANPNDKAFGRAPKVEDVEAALAKAKPKKAPASVKQAVAKASKTVDSGKNTSKK